MDVKRYKDFQKYNIVVIIPAYKVEREISDVLFSVPDYVRSIIVVNDASPDQTADVIKKIAKRDKRIILLNHERNQGVGGAMITGFKKALELGAQIIVKMDGDGQMSPDLLPALLTPLIRGEADYTKGNRFRDFNALNQMPIIRRIGNIGLGFLTKVATGYWNCFDPANGFVAIRGDILSLLPLEKIDRGYFFETSMLSHLYLENAFIKDVPLPAVYGEEKSNMSLFKIILHFPVKLTLIFLRRIILKHFLFDFSLISIYVFAGTLLFAFGLIFGIVEWAHFSSLGLTASTGTVMLATLPVILGIQFLLSAISLDMQAVPKQPINTYYLDTNKK